MMNKERRRRRRRRRRGREKVRKMAIRYLWIAF
jgi:hypothetical protein